jgi:nucleoid DNA-binding protein
LLKVDKHISELLFEHDCVIVPEFGGFVANYTPAKIHPTQHTFTPPSKNIIFNKNLKNNDGLLASHIVNAEKSSYPEALKYINLFVSAANIQLKKGAKVEVEEVGTLYLDAERNIQFEPETTNYLLDAFGLAQFQSPAIKRDNIGKRIEKEFKDRGAVPQEKKKINIKRYVALALAIPIVFGMIWIPLKTDLLKNINSSSINPFASKDASKCAVVEKIKVIPSKTKDAASSVSANDTTKHITLNLSHNSSLPVTASLVENKSVGIVKADSTSVSVKNVNANTDFKFHVITGCFQIKENADRFLITLQKQNIFASIIGKRNGLYVVSAGNYATSDEAYVQIQQLRKSQPDVWMLKK